VSRVLGSPKAGENNLPARANKFLPVLAVASSKKELSPPQARQSHGGLSGKKKHQPVWPVAAAKEKKTTNL